MEDMGRICHLNAESGGRLYPEFEDISMTLFEMDLDAEALLKYQGENHKKQLDRNLPPHPSHTSVMSNVSLTSSFFFFFCSFFHSSEGQQEAGETAGGSPAAER